MSNSGPHRVTLKPIPGVSSVLELLTHDPATDLVSRRIHQERTWEVFETRLWIASHTNDCIVLDVGANLGYFSLLSALADVPAARVFAIEPARDNFQLLCDNLVLNHCDTRVVAVHGALGESEGQITLHRSEDNLGDHQVYAGDGPRSRELTQMLNGTAYLAERTERLDLVKIDTQGSELSVLRGLWPQLVRHRDGLRLLIELTPYSLRLAGASGRALIELLAELELPMHIVDHVDHRLVASDAQALATWCDNVDGEPGDRGFMNIFVGEAPAL